MDTQALLKEHDLEIDRISAELKKLHESKTKVRIFHGRTTSTRALHFDQKTIDVSALNGVLEVNETQRYAWVEPNVPMGELVEATLKHGLIPPVVTEFPSITVGGAVSGGAGESSSFKHGAFHNACEEYEVVLGNGEVVKASMNENQDLFRGLACACGSLGVITKIKIRLIRATHIVRLEYFRVNSFHEAQDKMEELIADPEADFVDGIMFAPDHGVIMFGRLKSDPKGFPEATFTRSSDPWFYTHAAKISRKHDFYEEAIPIRDYLFRYNRGAFWTGKYGFERYHIPFNALTRFIFNPLLTAKRLFRALHGANLSQEFFVQDTPVLPEKFVPYMQWLDKEYGMYPVWLLPLQKIFTSDWLSPDPNWGGLLINVGIYGMMKVPYEEFVQENRKLEKKLLEIDGRKVFYAHSYFTEDEFWTLFNKEPYNALRSKYHAKESFPSVYDKITVKGKYNSSIPKGVKGMFKTPYQKNDEKK